MTALGCHQPVAPVGAVDVLAVPVDEVPGVSAWVVAAEPLVLVVPLELLVPVGAVGSVVLPDTVAPPVDSVLVVAVLLVAGTVVTGAEEAGSVVPVVGPSVVGSSGNVLPTKDSVAAGVLVAVLPTSSGNPAFPVRDPCLRTASVMTGSVGWTLMTWGVGAGEAGFGRESGRSQASTPMDAAVMASAMPPVSTASNRCRP
jgi:hypothetical protein